MTTDELRALLREHLNSREWALFFEVANGTGARKTRSADAIAMHLWPSAGMEIHGFELKVSRSDWLRELKQPEKSAEVARYCDRWWLVVGEPEIVKPEELPSGWGLLSPKMVPVYNYGMGGDSEALRLVVERQASIRVCQQLERSFVASLLRAAQKGNAA